MDTNKNKTAREALSELRLALARTSESLQDLQYRLDKAGNAKAEAMVDNIIAQASSRANETV